jgi:hypothetical protein
MAGLRKSDLKALRRVVEYHEAQEAQRDTERSKVASKVGAQKPAARHAKPPPKKRTK